MLPVVSCAYEIKSDKFIITYPNDDVLEEFLDNTRFDGGFSLFGGGSSLTLKEQAANRVTRIIGKVEDILEMHPEHMVVKIVLFSDEKQVQRVYRQQYDRVVDFIAFYSPLDEKIYISTNNVVLRVIAHEMAHCVIYHYFKKQPPVKLHELMAQFVEAHIQD